MELQNTVELRLFEAIGTDRFRKSKFSDNRKYFAFEIAHYLYYFFIEVKNAL